MPAIFHMTHAQNLPGILAQGGLWCDRIAAEKNLCQQSIAHAHIKARRAARAVTTARGGFLADYVPFYFATRQPMLYAIRGGQVAAYSGGQGDVVYLRLSTDAIIHSGLPFAFTNGHAEMALAEFSSVPDQLVTMVDWQLMKAQYWNDTADDPNRKFRRQAEFLVREFVPWHLTEEIGVYSDPTASAIAAVCQAQPTCPTINVRREWYFT